MAQSTTVEGRTIGRYRVQRHLATGGIHHPQLELRSRITLLRGRDCSIQRWIYRRLRSRG